MKPLLRIAELGMSLVLLLLTIVSPVAACLQDKASLNPAGQACCRQMGPMCASSPGMASHHPCCRITVESPQDAIAPAVSITLVSPDLSSVAIFTNPESLSFHPGKRAAVVSPSPPEATLSRLQVFRI